MNLAGREYDTVEFFAGCGRLTTAFRMTGRRSVALDEIYDDVVKKKGSMNIMTDAGFVWLDPTLNSGFGCFGYMLIALPS